MPNDETYFPSVRATFDYWRVSHRTNDGWGLAWFLANEFCERFYASHGIVPQVIDHDGLGYYGIELARVSCAVNGSGGEPLGRLTMGGDVENWRSGGPGDHGLGTMEMCDAGVATSDIVAKAIAHMGISPIPDKTHARCRHKLRGASYELVFRLAAIVALRSRSISIWNHPDSLRFALTPPSGTQAATHDSAGAFVFVKGDREFVVSGDGRVFGSSAENLWVNYMRGASIDSLVSVVEGRILV